MKHQLYFGVALVALSTSTLALAQSTGTVDAEQTIVVTASQTRNGVAGIVVPIDPKAKEVLTQEAIARQRPGQTINDIINQLPGVSFTNNDPYGSAGGTLTIRGFDSSRISQTFDGIPLNDSGNYALFSNQQLDPELIEQVNVNLGTTDVDSPTASATGSTVNYRSLVPTDAFGARVSASYGEYNFFRDFALINTGRIGPLGTKAWLAVSHATNDVVFNNYGKINKTQFNGKIYQPIGDNGDFISVAAHYNINRNNFFGSAPLRNDTSIFSSTLVGGVPVLNSATPRLPGTATTNRFPATTDERYTNILPCQTTVGVTGTVQTANSCGTIFEYRANPSNTGNIRVQSRFTPMQGVVLTIEPSYQYVKANGGGTATAREGIRTAATPVGYFGGSPYLGGVSINGDGDTLDQVTVLAPSQTRTRRYGVIASLRYDFMEGQSVRVAYSHDYANHRQTGEIQALTPYGTPFDVFPVNNPIVGANGRVLQKRDRQSLAILDQISGEYRGKFFDNKLNIVLGVRAPFFKRDLNNYCFTTAANGNVDCLGLGNTADNATYAAANPTFSPPQRRRLTYQKVLPNVGVTYTTDFGLGVFANYSKGLQVPGTDNLYNSFFFAVGTPSASPTAETTDNFDVGIRYKSSKIQAQVGPWYTKFQNRLASAYDPVLDQTIFRNLGDVKKYGIDGSIAYRPIKEVLLYAFGSYLKSEIQSNVQLGTVTTLVAGGAALGTPIFAQTQGKRESGAPVYTLGGRVQGDFGPVSFGAQAKYTGKRYVNDQNLPVVQCTVAFVNQTVCPATGIQYQAYGASAPGFTVVDLDARVNLGFLGLNDKTYLQFNVSNVFDKLYVNNFGGTLSTTGVGFVQVGAPRAISGTLNVAF